MDTYDEIEKAIEKRIKKREKKRKPKMKVKGRRMYQLKEMISRKECKKCKK